MTKERAGFYDLHVEIPLTMRKEARAAAEAEDRSLTQWVRRAIREKLDRDQAPEREA